jgi:hypothetical protein
VRRGLAGSATHARRRNLTQSAILSETPGSWRPPSAASGSLDLVAALATKQGVRVAVITADVPRLQHGSRIVMGHRGREARVMGQLEVEHAAVEVGDPEIVA